MNDWSRQVTNYGMERLLKGQKIHFGSSKLPHRLHYDSRSGTVTVSTEWATMIVPPEVAAYIAALVTHGRQDSSGENQKSESPDTGGAPKEMPLPP